jgi:DNA-binding MarR family transcriptional regulator
MSAAKTPSEMRSGPEWQRKREQALRRDQYRCRYCDRRDGKRGTDLHVHHIKPLKKGGGNELSNLAVLCNSCHNRLHTQFSDYDELRPSLLEDYNPATLNWTVGRRELTGCDQKVVDYLYENGATKLEHMTADLDYKRSTVSNSLNGLMDSAYVCRVSRGVYAYITTLEHRRMLARESDKHGRREVVVWRPGEQSTLDSFQGGRRR